MHCNNFLETVTAVEALTEWTLRRKTAGPHHARTPILSGGVSGEFARGQRIAQLGEERAASARRCTSRLRFSAWASIALINQGNLERFRA